MRQEVDFRPIVRALTAWAFVVDLLETMGRERNQMLDGQRDLNYC